MISRALMESSLLSVNSARSIYSIYGEILQILYIHDRTIYIDHLCTYYARLHLPGNLTYSRIPSFLISNDNSLYDNFEHFILDKKKCLSLIGI